MSGRQLAISPIQATLEALRRELVRERERNNYFLGFGAPRDGPKNLVGRWVRVQFTAADQSQTFRHDLGVPVTTSGEPNVAWLVMGVRHSGTQTNPGGPIHIEFEDGSSVTENAIDLTLRLDANRTVNGSGDEATVLAFIVPTGEWS